MVGFNISGELFLYFFVKTWASLDQEEKGIRSHSILKQGFLVLPSQIADLDLVGKKKS